MPDSGFSRNKSPRLDLVLTVILPVKRLNAPKLRLASLLTAQERRDLVLAMLEDVGSAVIDTGFIPRVLSPDPEVLAFAEGIGAAPLLQSPRARSLNAALTIVLQACSGSALVILPDTPLVTPGEIEALVRSDSVSDGRGNAPGVAIAPDRRNSGTSALFLSPADAIPVHFGAGSLARHTEAAAQRGLAAAVHRLPGLGLDIDTPDDVLAFLAVESDTRTRVLIESLQLQHRLAERAASS